VGFRALIWLPSDFLAPIQNFVWFTRIAGAVVTSLALPLGVAIFIGSKRAILLTKIYLWLVLVLGGADMVVLGCEWSILGPKALTLIGSFALTCSFALFFCGSFAHEDFARRLTIRCRQQPLPLPVAIDL